MENLYVALNKMSSCKTRPHLLLQLLHSNNTNAIVLNAVWSFNKPYIQNPTLAECQKNVWPNGNATNIGDTITVYDRRASDGAGNWQTNKAITQIYIIIYLGMARLASKNTSDYHLMPIRCVMIPN